MKRAIDHRQLLIVARLSTPVCGVADVGTDILDMSIRSECQLPTDIYLRCIRFDIELAFKRDSAFCGTRSMQNCSAYYAIMVDGILFVCGHFHGTAVFFFLRW